MSLGRRTARHDTARVQKVAVDSSVWWEYKPEQRVMTIDGIPGVVTAVLDGPHPGSEAYVVRLDDGLGGGQYTASQLSSAATTTASHEHEATGLHLAHEDYPELGTILYDRPPIERQEHLASKVAGRDPFEIRHVEHDTGGTKFPTKVETTAHHLETGDQVGHARYFPPKRKGGPISIDEVKGQEPGAASAMLNDIEGRHPGSKTVFLNEVKRNNNNPDVTGHAADNAGKPSDWDTHYPNVKDTIHRGLSVRMPSHSANTVNSSLKTKDEHLDALHREIGTSSAGTHWTEDEHAARLFANNAVSDHRTDIPVVLHAAKPDRKSIETRQTQLYRGGVFPYGDGHSKENEVPIRKGRDVSVTGISWKPDAPHPDADENGWIHHTYPEPKHHTAAGEPPTGEPMGQDLPPCSYCGSANLTVSGDNGRNTQATCEDCHGTMSSWGGQFTPELIGDPSNHPSQQADPDSGGVGGAGNLWGPQPVKQMNDADHTASLRRVAEEDYRMQHQPPDAGDGVPLHDLAGNNNAVYPDDIYTHTHYYAQPHEADTRESISAMHQARGKPNKKVKVYRAMPADSVHHGIQTGNWVTTSKEYARGHGRHHEDSKKDWPVISATVEAQHLRTDGNDLREYGYHGPKIEQHGVAFAGGHEEKVSARADGTVRRVQRKANPFKEREQGLKSKGYSFSHYRPTSEDNPDHAVVAYDHEDNWAGQVKAHRNGEVHHVEIDPEHAHHPLEEHMRDMIARDVKRTGSLSFLASLDSETLFQFTAAWSDVRAKAKRLRAEGSVNITVASSDGIGGEVKGDNNVYETVLSYAPGSQKVAYWTCGCKWAAYAWGRSPAYKRFEGRMCSHALAMQFEAQSRGMFGKTVRPDETRPKWLRQRTPVVIQHERDTGKDLTRRTVPPGNMRRTFEGAISQEALDFGRRFMDMMDPHHMTPQVHTDEFFHRYLDEPPIVHMARFDLNEGGEPVDVMRSLMEGGFDHKSAKRVLRRAMAGTDTRCPDCGSEISSHVAKCPHCGAELSTPDSGDMHLAAMRTMRCGACGSEQPENGRQGTMECGSCGTPLHGADTFDEADADKPLTSWKVTAAHVSCGECEGAGTIEHEVEPTDEEAEDPNHVPGKWHETCDVCDGSGKVNLDDDEPEGENPHDKMVREHVANPASGAPHGVDCPPFCPVQKKMPLAERQRVRTEWRARHGVKSTQDGPTHAGVVLKARDTGRILMLQRNLEDEKDPAAGKWEWPGGGIEEGDTTALHAGIREWEEEVGQKFPQGGAVHHVWSSPNGIYHGHVVVIPEERQVALHDGRVTTNPDDPDGKTAEQAAWWEVSHAKKNPALRPECRNSPWKEIGKAGANAKTAAAWDMLEELNQGHTPPLHSESENPGSTGFATAQDPPEFDHPTINTTLYGGAWGSLHDVPEPALPSTDGADEDFDNPAMWDVEQHPATHDEISDAPLSPQQFTGSVDDIVARFQATAGAQAINAGGAAGAGPSDGDIASAAKAFLDKTALKQFNFHEQQELITEGALDNVMARNSDRLDIADTHYHAIDAALAAEEAVAHPDDLFS